VDHTMTSGEQLTDQLNPKLDHTRGVAGSRLFCRVRLESSVHSRHRLANSKLRSHPPSSYRTQERECVLECSSVGRCRPHS
jgi:hypothetical protein